jgi:hypothetical protein
MGLKKYAYQNELLKSIKGEMWKPIDGYEGLYEISSLGRVKTLKRAYVNNLGANVLVKERILKQHLAVTRSKTNPHNSYALSVGLCLDGKRQIAFVGRLVYYAFVEPFDRNDRRLLISYKDWDGRNIQPHNLYRTTISELMQLSHDQQRYQTILSEKSKPISQFDINGTHIAHYKSIQDAARNTGFTAENISNAANGIMNLCRGFVWQFGNSKRMKKNKPEQEKDGGVHQRLMTQLGLTATGVTVPAIADLRLKALEGEIWKAVPGFEDYYEISNYGRVKAKGRVSKGKQQHWQPEMIKNLGLKPHAHKPNELSGNLNVAISKEGVRTSFIVARLVYHGFVEAIKLHDFTHPVCFRDGNRFNLHFSNLYLPIDKKS